MRQDLDADQRRSTSIDSNTPFKAESAASVRINPNSFHLVWISNAGRPLLGSDEFSLQVRDHLPRRWALGYFLSIPLSRIALENFADSAIFPK